jgi:hypothetical protein
MKKGFRIWLLAAGCWLFSSTVSFAEKITILYTGQTHAALYRCPCPKEMDGGVARRMTKVKELRKKNPDTILLDAGGFFAGGMLDEHGLGLELDKARNEINLKALEIMGYDALGIGDDEFNFGKDYLKERIRASKVPFVSANLKIEGVRPYIIKQTSSSRIAVIGLTNPEAAIKSAEVEVKDAKASLLDALGQAKKDKADINVVLSYLGEEKDRELAQEVKGVDIIICGRPEDSVDAYTQIDSTYIVRPVWQGRRLSRLDVELENRKVKNLKLSQIRLSEEIVDAPEITRILPQCFSDKDCFKNGIRGRCNNPAKLDASCSFETPKKISLLIIQPANLQIAHQEQFIAFLRGRFPGIESRFIDSDSAEGKSFIRQSQAKLLPVYLLAKEAQAEKGFKEIEEFAQLKGNYYYLIPRLTGGSIFVGRAKVDKRLGVFLGTKNEHIEGILSVLKQLSGAHKELQLNIHYLAIEGPKGFEAPGGVAELEESMRQVCVKQYYPEKFWDYAICRAGVKESTWWDLCAKQHRIDAKKIKNCALSDEAVRLLRENTALNKELEIAAGPTLLVNNYIVIGLSGVPSLETLEKMLGLK